MKKEVGFENLHVHTDFSLLDGFAQVEEYAERCTKIGQRFLCISDHGMMAAIPRQIRACEVAGINPIFASELYLQNKHHLKEHLSDLSDQEKKEVRKSYHLLAIAYNNVGYTNLVTLTSWAWLNGFYYKPRTNYEQLMKHKEGIIFTSCCYNGEIGQAFDRGGEDAANEMLEKYIEMFAPNFFLELMLLDFKKQRPYDAWLIKARDKYHIPLIVTCDAHYSAPEDSKYQRYMLMVQTGRTLEEFNTTDDGELDDKSINKFELQDKNLWLKSEPEIDQKWEEATGSEDVPYHSIIPYELLLEAKQNTVAICERAKGVKIDRSVKLPQLPNAEEELLLNIKRGFIWRGLKGKNTYAKRLQEEYELICRKGFASYFLIQQKITDEARRICPQILGWGNGDEACGPGRGCLGPDVRVFLSNGSAKPISEIVPGDQVFTRSGKPAFVLNKLEYEVDEPLLNIRSCYGDNAGVTLTKDHQVLAEKVIYDNDTVTWKMSTRKRHRRAMTPTGKLEWFRADQLEEGDWVFIPRPKIDEAASQTIDLALYSDGGGYSEDYVYHKGIKARRRTIRHIEPDAKWFYVLGLFAGRGNLYKKEELIEFFVESGPVKAILMKKLKELGATIHCRRHHHACMRVFAKHKHLYNLFADWFYRGEVSPGNKKLPEFIHRESYENKKLFVQGLGARAVADHLVKYEVDMFTRSVELSYQLQFLCLQLGLPASRYHKNNYELVRLPGLVARSYRELDGGFFTRIRKIKEVTGVKKVYDLTVEGDPNYLTSSFVVHNSCVGSLVCYVLGITSVDPVRHDLLFSRFLNESRGGRAMRIRFTNLNDLGAAA